jgi:hypothetical protein
VEKFIGLHFTQAKRSYIVPLKQRQVYDDTLRFESDRQIDNRDMNEQVTKYKSLENPYSDISYGHAKRQSKIPCLDQNQQATHQHTMRAAPNIIANTPFKLMDGVISSYTCTNPTLGLENGLSAPPVVFNCDEYVIDNTGLNILWYGDPSFDSQAVQWYRHYISHQSSIEKNHAATYLILEPTSNGGVATSGYIAVFTKISPRWDGHHDLAAELEHLLHSGFAPDSEKLEYDGDDDRDVRHSHRGGHDHELHWKIVLGRKRIMYHRKVPNPSKLHDLEGGIMTRGLMISQLKNTREVLAMGIAIVLTECRIVPGNALAEDPKGRNKRSEITCVHMVVYRTYVRVPRWEALPIDKWDAESCASRCGLRCPWEMVQRQIRKANLNNTLMGYALESHFQYLKSLRHVKAALAAVLHLNAPIPKKLIAGESTLSTLVAIPGWLDVAGLVIMNDYRKPTVCLPRSRIENPLLSLIDWYSEPLTMNLKNGLTSSLATSLTGQLPLTEKETRTVDLELRKIQVLGKNDPQWNALQEKEDHWIHPKPAVVKILLLTEFMRVLLERGSLGDDASSALALADWSVVGHEPQESSVPCQSAMQQLRSKDNMTSHSHLVIIRSKYQSIIEGLTIVSLQRRDHNAILDSQTILQCRLFVGSNPARVVASVGNDEAQSLRSLGSRMNATANRWWPRYCNLLLAKKLRIEGAREELRNPLCCDGHGMNLSYRDVLTISLAILSVNESETHLWRHFRCPDALRAQFAEKRCSYLSYKRCEIITVTEKIVLTRFIQKISTRLGVSELQTVVAHLGERNQNTHKLILPLPDYDCRLKHAATGQVCITFYTKSSFEQIHLVPGNFGHDCTLLVDGDTTVVKRTFGSQLYRLFVSHIGPSINDTSLWERLHLNQTKIHLVLLASVLRIVGFVIDDQTTLARKDTDRSDYTLNWKAPANCSIALVLLGPVEHLVDHIHDVRILLEMLVRNSPSPWDFPEQPAFVQAKDLDHRTREHHQVHYKCVDDMVPEWTIMDGVAKSTSITGQEGVWQMEKSSFPSAEMNDDSTKLDNIYQTCSMHDVGMLTCVQIGAILFHEDILLGFQSSWLKNHNKQIHLPHKMPVDWTTLLTRRLERITPFDLRLSFVEWSKNVIVTDTLSSLHASYSPSMERARTELRYRNAEQDAVEVMTGDTSVDDPDDASEIANDDIVVAGVGGLEHLDVETQANTGWEHSDFTLRSNPSDGNRWDRPMHSYFVLECLAGRKEGGSTSKISRTNNASNTDRSTLSTEANLKAVTVTVTEVLTRTSSKADTPEATLTALVSHFQSDGSTKRVKHTIANMVRQPVGLHQTSVSKLLPGFPIDSVKSYMPRFTSWAFASATEHTSAVRKLALQKKLLVLRNQERRLEVASLNFGDIIHLSHKIINDFGNTYFQLKSYPLLKKYGVCDIVFRAFLLVIHIPSDDRLFLGHRDTPVNDTDDPSGEWTANLIMDPVRSQTDAVCEAPLLKLDDTGSYPEDDSQLVIGSSTLNQSTCLPSPSLTIIFLCLSTTAFKTCNTTSLVGSILELHPVSEGRASLYTITQSFGKPNVLQDQLETLSDQLPTISRIAFAISTLRPSLISYLHYFFPLALPFVISLSLPKFVIPLQVADPELYDDLSQHTDTTVNCLDLPPSLQTTYTAHCHLKRSITLKRITAQALQLQRGLYHSIRLALSYMISLIPCATQFLETLFVSCRKK